MKKKVLVLLLIIAIVCSLFAFVACNDPNGNTQDGNDSNQGEIGGGEQNQPDDNRPGGDNNQSGNEDDNQDDTAAVELKPANQNYKGEQIDYSLYFETDGNGKIVALSDYAIEQRESIIQIEIPEKIGNEDITALSLSFDDLPFLRSVVIPKSIEFIEESLFSLQMLLSVYCEAESKPSGWCEIWRTMEVFAEYYDTAEMPVIWDCKNNIVADDGYIYSFSSNGGLYGLKNGKARMMFSGIGTDENLVLETNYKLDGKKYVLNETMPYAFCGLDWQTDSYIQTYKNLKHVEFPKNIEIIGTGAFLLYSNLESAKISNTVTKLGDGAFTECENMTSVIFERGSQLTYIGDFAFDYCRKLKQIDIPSKVEHIGSYVFRECVSLETINIDADNNKYISDNNCIMEVASSKLIAGCKTSKIPNYTKCIGATAFYGCHYLESIELPNTVTAIEEDAFRECYGLTSVVIPLSVESIGRSAFSSCSAVIYCEAESKPDGWIYGWANSRVVWDYKNNDTTEEGRVYYIAENKIKYIIYNNGSLSDGIAMVDGSQSRTLSGDIEILSQITYKGEVYPVRSVEFDAFEKCIYLTSVYIPSSVLNVYFNVFSGCNELTIYCEAESQPSGWTDDWNASNFPVVWGYKKS